MIILAGGYAAWDDPDIRFQIEKHILGTVDSTIEEARAATQKNKSISSAQILQNLTRGITSLEDGEYIYIETLAENPARVLDFDDEWCLNSKVHYVLSEQHKSEICSRIHSMKTVLIASK